MGRGGEGFRCVFEAFLYSPNLDRLLCTTKGAVVNCLVCLPSSPELNVCAVYMQACAK